MVPEMRTRRVTFCRAMTHSSHLLLISGRARRVVRLLRVDDKRQEMKEAGADRGGGRGEGGGGGREHTGIAHGGRETQKAKVPTFVRTGADWGRSAHGAAQALCRRKMSQLRWMGSGGGRERRAVNKGEIEEREWSSAQGRTEIRAYGVVGREEGIRRRRIALPARGPHFRRRRTR